MLPRHPRPRNSLADSELPEVAAAASWTEALKLPLREIKRRYTKSDLTVMAWRSNEIAMNMDKQHEEIHTTAKKGRSESQPATSADHVQDTVRQAYGTGQGRTELAPVSREEAELEARLGPVASKLTDDLNLKRLTGQEARRFFAAQGIQIPLMSRKPKKELNLG